jgi:hypothetical protein
MGSVVAAGAASAVVSSEAPVSAQETAAHKSITQASNKANSLFIITSVGVDI